MAVAVKVTDADGRPWRYSDAPEVLDGLQLKLIDHDRSHSCPPVPEGHAACDQPGCRNAKLGTYYNGSSECAQIKEGAWYICRVFEGWFMGRMHRDYHDEGWDFDGWRNPSLDLNAVWLVYEVVGLPTGPEVDPWSPPQNVVAVCTDYHCYDSDFTHPKHRVEH